jgi:hypothetical protein
LTFDVDATLIGELNFKDLSKADFTFNADFEQHVLDYIHDELLNLLTKAQQAAEEGIEAAKKQVAAEQATLDIRIAQAKAELKLTQATWEAHQKSVTQTHLKVIDDYNAKIKTLQDSVTSAEKAYDAATQKAKTNLTNAQHDRQVKIQTAKNNLESAKRKATSDIEHAKANMNRDFGSTEKNIEGAKRKVKDLQSQINSINHKINSSKQSKFSLKNLNPELRVQLGALEASLKIAQGTLDAAQAILKSANYVAEKSALDAAQRGLDLAAQTGALTIVDKLTQAVVDGATEALRAVQSGSEAIAFDGAKAALATYKRTGDVVLKDANTAIADLVKSVEYVAFVAATTALATAQGATKGLNAATILLSEVEKGSADLSSIGKAIVNAGGKALDITSVHLSGSLGKSAGGAGLTADVKGIALGKPFKINVVLDPSKVENFLTGVFHE